MKKTLLLTAFLAVLALGAKAADGATDAKPADAKPADAKPADPKLAAVKANWDTHCKKCHGEDGKGQTTMGKKLSAKDYTDPKVQKELKDEDMLKIIKEGSKAKDGTTLMKGYADVLSADENKAFIGYIRAFKK